MNLSTFTPSGLVIQRPAWVLQQVVNHHTGGHLSAVSGCYHTHYHQRQDFTKHKTYTTEEVSTYTAPYTHKHTPPHKTSHEGGDPGTLAVGLTHTYTNQHVITTCYA